MESSVIDDNSVIEPAVVVVNPGVGPAIVGVIRVGDDVSVLSEYSEMLTSTSGSEVARRLPGVGSGLSAIGGTFIATATDDGVSIFSLSVSINDVTALGCIFRTPLIFRESLATGVKSVRELMSGLLSMATAAGSGVGLTPFLFFFLCSMRYTSTSASVTSNMTTIVPRTPKTIS